MCGIAGFLQRTTASIEGQNILQSMADQLSHRGPDDCGIWYDAAVGVGLAHRRLAIVDLSPEGHQPMFSAHSRYLLVFNGEIYNYRKLMKELQQMGHQFRGHSDTEVILAAVEQWGVNDAVVRFVGMFAFALWDRMQLKLYLVRDRMGEKPLYYGDIGGTFIFSSELKAMRMHPCWQPRLDMDALALFMRRGYIPAPYSIYQGIFKLSPGVILTVDLSRPAVRLAEKCYWSLDSVVREGQENPIVATEKSMISRLEQLMLSSIEQQMLADVPLGAFLSGGVDSSTVVAMMQSLSSRPVETFSIGFSAAEFDEAGYAKKVASYLGTHHTELYVTADEAMSVIPRLAHIYDEPFADSSQIPTYIVCQLAKRHVTVSLSGDGGDELFCGYKRYLLVNDVWKRLECIPRAMRAALVKMILAVPTSSLDYIFQWLSPLFGKYGSSGNAGDKIRKLASLLDASNQREFYQKLTSNWTDINQVMAHGYDKARATNVSDIGLSAFDHKDYLSSMMHLDTKDYLPNDILVKLDRASMAISLESRIPLLDHRIVEYAWRLPLTVKYKNGQTKWILRQILHKYVPKAYFDRPKKGFGVPIANWLSGPLREWGETLLEENLIRQQGYLNSKEVRDKWREHLNGSRNWQSQLWNILMFQCWLEGQ